MASPSDTPSTRGRLKTWLLAVSIMGVCISLALRSFASGSKHIRDINPNMKESADPIALALRSFSSRPKYIRDIQANMEESADPFETTAVRKEDIEDDGTKENAITNKLLRGRNIIVDENEEPAPIDEPLNVIIFYPDDWTHHDLEGVVPVLKTPFLTQLAKEGIRFSQNAVTTSICWISRATLYTGQYVSRHGSTYLFRPRFTEKKYWMKSYPYMLKHQAGYFTGLVGKWQYRRAPDDLFDFQRMYHGSFWFDNVKTENGTIVRKHVCEKTRDDAIDFLNERPKDKPFSLTVSLGPPKGGVTQDQTYDRFLDIYKHAFFPEPYNQTHAYSVLPWFLQNDNTQARKRWAWRWGGFGKFQKSLKVYFALLTQVDEAIKEVVDVLKEQGVYNKTMIIFTPDNGEFRAAHGLSDKWYPYQESIRVPLIIRDPRMPKEKKGTVDESFTLNVDLASTILGAAGLKSDNGMQGRDISNLYLHCKDDDELCQKQWRSEFYYEFPINSSDTPMSSALVRKDWKFMTWKGYNNYEQLFNLESDPMEMNDLRNETEFKGLVDEMRARHDELKVAVMSPIVPGTQCDMLWPPASDISKEPACCCENGTQIDMNEV